MMGFHYRTGGIAVAVLASINLIAPVMAVDPSTTPQLMIPASEMQMQMQLSLLPVNGSSSPRFMLLPLTTGAGPKSSATGPPLAGTIIATDVQNYVSITGGDKIRLMSCDPVSSSILQPNDILKSLVTSIPPPKAIVFYTLGAKYCSVAPGDSSYSALYSMADSNEAKILVNTTTVSNGTTQGIISGNSTTAAPPTSSSPAPVAQEQSNANGTAAMSILYSITGLITITFLGIITTGAMRAHRNPQRYGLRPGSNGQPAQSRARGLARAVLETLPIVKFGDSNAPKTNQAIELEEGRARTATDAEPNAGGDHEGAPTTTAAATTLHHDGANESTPPATATAVADAIEPAPRDEEENPGCSICTEDFNAGEDVRVLPCNHKFHPACVDPWLTNVSGTCPLCRLDLRPGQGQTPAETDDSPLSPPLGGEDGEEATTDAAAPGPSRNRRASRLLDAARLRSAGREERLAALRRHRDAQRQQQQAGSGTTPNTEEHTRRARLAARLGERFHVRTREQPSQVPQPAQPAATRAASAPALSEDNAA